MLPKTNRKKKKEREREKNPMKTIPKPLPQ